MLETRSAMLVSPDGKSKQERACIVHEGREYCASGAYVTPTHAAGYPKAGKILSWNGEEIGTCAVTASWPVRSIYGSRMYQIQAFIDGRFYTGRGFGDGMLWRGKVKRSLVRE